MASQHLVRNFGMVTLYQILFAVYTTNHLKSFLQVWNAAFHLTTCRIVCLQHIDIVLLYCYTNSNVLNLTGAYIRQ